MKKNFFPLLAGLGMACSCLTVACAQQPEYREHLSKEFTLQKPVGSVLALYNLNGSVKIQGYDGDKVLIEVDERIFAKTEESLGTGKKEFKLTFQQNGDSVLAYIAEPYDTRPHTNCYCCCNNSRRIDYDFQLEFTVKVPRGMDLVISTINQGDINIQDVAGMLKINNINGKITIKNARGTTDAHTINGNLTINYLSSPPGESNYYTLNGTLEVTYPANLSADLQFKSMNGGFYTDFANLAELPVHVTKNVSKEGSGTVYKLNIDKQVRIGNGGRLFRFETMNGNIYIKNGSKSEI